jgi:microcompartment protein CcmL/EutN
MSMKALGMIETYGLIGAIEAADVMLKVADVSLIKKETVQGGLILVMIDGDVAAVKTAVDAGVSAVTRLGAELLYGAHVIPRPDDQMAGLYPEDQVEEKPEEIISPVEEELLQDLVIDEALKSETSETKEAFEAFETVEELEAFLKKKRVAEVRELVLNNENISVSEDELANLVKRELIELLISDFQAKNEK